MLCLVQKSLKNHFRTNSYEIDEEEVRSLLNEARNKAEIIQSNRETIS